LHGIFTRTIELFCRVPSLSCTLCELDPIFTLPSIARVWCGSTCVECGCAHVGVHVASSWQQVPDSTAPVREPDPGVVQALKRACRDGARDVT
jgi:hypothetical protein